MIKLAFVLLLTISAFGQSTVTGQVSSAAATATPGTTVNGPLLIMPPANPVNNSGFSFTDLGLPPIPPAPKQYLLSISNGVIMESDNNGAYHSLVGPAGVQGPIGPTGPAGPQGATGPTGPQGPAGSVPSNVLTRGSTVTVVCPKGVSATICNKTVTLQ